MYDELWSNSAPSTAWSGGNVQLAYPRTNYKYLVITFKSNINRTRLKTMVLPNAETSFELDGLDIAPNQALLYRRYFTN